MAFLALKKEKLEAFSNICLRAQEVIRGQKKGTVETVSLKMRQFWSLLSQDLGQI